LDLPDSSLTVYDQIINNKATMKQKIMQGGRVNCPPDAVIIVALRMVGRAAVAPLSGYWTGTE
jgi:uncharacterized lipoprotein YbaY